MECFSTTKIEEDCNMVSNFLSSTSQPPRRPGSAASEPQHGDAPSSDGRSHQQPHHSPKKQLPSPISKAPAAKARTTGELLEMLSSMPQGQPFEIDPQLLYSPQSSFAGGGHGSPGARSASQDSLDWDCSLGGDFSLPAYRPSKEEPFRQLFVGTEHEAAASSRLQDGSGSVTAPDRSQQQQNVQQQQQENCSQGSGAVLNRGRNARIAQLAQPRTTRWRQCAQIKVDEETSELQECTFKPKTGRPPNVHRLAPGIPVEERLQLSQAGRQEALERARVAKEQEQLLDCTFTPQLATQPERHLRQEYIPLHQRVGHEQKQRSSKLAQAQLWRDSRDSNLTFKPQLNQRSLQLAREREARALFEQPSAALRPASAGPLHRGGQTDDADFTFTPSINAASERLLEDSADVPTDFQERLRYYSLMKQQRRQAAAASADAEACTFRPDTANAVMVLALSANHAGNLLETEQERYERMAGGEVQRMAEQRAAIEAEVYGGMEFTPQLNPRSVALAPAGSGGVHGLAAMANKQRRRLAQLRQAEEDRQRLECTFQPDTRKPRVKGYYDEYQPPRPNAPLSITEGVGGLTQRIADYQADKESRIAAAKAEDEAKKLAECSFAPDINRPRVQAKGAVVVRGLERHLELRQLAERRKAEAEERAAKVFLTHPAQNQGTTVPRPFQLAGHAVLEAKAAERQAALLSSRLCDHLRDCTFQPKTNTQRRQVQLEHLLRQPSDDLILRT